MRAYHCYVAGSVFAALACIVLFYWAFYNRILKVLLVVIVFGLCLGGLYLGSSIENEGNGLRFHRPIDIRNENVYNDYCSNRNGIGDYPERGFD